MMKNPFKKNSDSEEPIDSNGFNKKNENIKTGNVLKSSVGNLDNSSINKSQNIIDDNTNNQQIEQPKEAKNEKSNYDENTSERISTINEDDKNIENNVSPINNIKTYNFEDIIMDISNKIKMLEFNVEIIHKDVEEIKSSSISSKTEYSHILTKVDEKLDNISKELEINHSNHNQQSENRINALAEYIIDVKNSVAVLKQYSDDIKENTDKMKTIMEFSNNVNSISDEVSDGVVKEAEISAESKEEFKIVELFIDNSEIKFRISSRSTPFYIHRYEKMYTLIINDNIYHTANIDSIERCFYIDGDKTGKYANVKPAECSYNEDTNDWKLIEKGRIKGVN